MHAFKACAEITTAANIIQKHHDSPGYTFVSLCKSAFYFILEQNGSIAMPSPLKKRAQTFGCG